MPCACATDAVIRPDQYAAIIYYTCVLKNVKYTVDQTELIGRMRFCRLRTHAYSVNVLQIVVLQCTGIVDRVLILYYETKRKTRTRSKYYNKIIGFVYKRGLLSEIFLILEIRADGYYFLSAYTCTYT